MIKSMTGFGKATSELSDKILTIQLRSLNSKSFDLNMKIPAIYRDKETDLRSEVAKDIERGKVELNIQFEHNRERKGSSVNGELVLYYYNELKAISDQLNEKANILDVVFRMPDIFESPRTEVDEGEWLMVMGAIRMAIKDFDTFRTREGNNLQKDLELRVRSILQLLSEVQKYEEMRMLQIRTRLTEHLHEMVNIENVDANRFEQELVYYLEKIDITEEKVRLKSHCDFFIDTMNDEVSNGRKLGFISQEIGREINTIGSKANDANMQKCVVLMKDELEKIKEQLLNVL